MANNFTGSGHLGSDAEVKNVNGVNVTVLSVAVRNGGAKKDDKPLWIRVNCWNSGSYALSDWMANLKKGDWCCFGGELRVNEHQGKTYHDVRAAWCESPVKSQQQAPAAQQAAPIDDDIPF